ADAGEVFVELVSIVGAEMRLHPPGRVADRVKDTPSVAQSLGLRLHVLRASFLKQLGEHAGGETVRRHQRAAARPRQAESLAREGQAGEARRAADTLGRELVERDTVAETRPSLRMRGCGQKAEDGIVAGADLRMRQAGHDGEVVAELLERLQVGCERVILAGLLREEVRRME